jgi:four helix bundle protein
MGQSSFETLRVYQLAEALAGKVWSFVLQWSAFPKDTLAKQLVRAADSVGANIAEGYGRGSYVDLKRFVLIARGSLNETICWIRRAGARILFTPEQIQSLNEITNELAPSLNAYLNYVHKQIKDQSSRGQAPME